MNQFALIVDGRVAEVFDETQDGVPLEKRYHPEFLAQLVAFDARNPPAEPAAPAQSVPAQVTMRQARLALLAAGKLSAVTAAIASLPSPQKEAAQIEWEYAATVERDSAFVHLMAMGLQLDEAALDALFTQAATL